METVIVTRHTALVTLIRERGICGTHTVLDHVSALEEIRGKHVIGVLPLHLAAVAAVVTEIPLSLSATDRGQELTLRRLREIAGDPQSYTVQRVATPARPD